MAVKEAVDSKTGTKYKLPKQYKVLMYNDDFTTMDFVVEILQTIFNKAIHEAAQIMMRIHKGSYAVVGVYTKDIAQTKAKAAEQQARQRGFPLKLEVVPEEK